MPAQRYVVALPRFPHFCGFRFLLRELRSQIALFANVLREASELPSALGRKFLSPAVPSGRLPTLMKRANGIFGSRHHSRMSDS